MTFIGDRKKKRDKKLGQLDKLTILSNICGNFHQKELFLAILTFLIFFPKILMKFFF